MGSIISPKKSGLAQNDILKTLVNSFSSYDDPCEALKAGLVTTQTIPAVRGLHSILDEDLLYFIHHKLAGWDFLLIKSFGLHIERHIDFILTEASKGRIKIMKYNIPDSFFTFHRSKRFDLLKRLCLVLSDRQLMDYLDNWCVLLDESFVLVTDEWIGRKGDLPDYKKMIKRLGNMGYHCRAVKVLEFKQSRRK